MGKSCSSSIICRLVAVIFCFFLLVTCYLSLVTLASSVCPLSSAYAQTNTNLLNQINQQGVTSGTFDDKYFNLNQLYGIMDNTAFFLIGSSSLHPEMQVALERNGSSGGIVAQSGQLLAFFATQPVSGTQYFASVFKDAGFLTEAQAQGFGYSQGLQPVQRIWMFFRNLAYAGFVIIFVVLGFMIMLRAKIDPQTVASVQTALPRIVIALVLVTFSYALAGLLVDLLYVLTGLAVNILAAGTGNGGSVTSVANGNAITSIFGLWSNTSSNLASFVLDTTQNVNSLIGAIAKVFSWIVEDIIKVVLAIVFLFIAFRIFFILIMAYVQIIILTIFAPIQFLVSAMPGQSPMGWFKSMLANILVFPTVIIMLAFADFLNQGLSGGNFFAAPLIGGYGANALAGLVSFGVIMMIPKAAEMVKAAIEKKAIPFGVDFGPVAGAAAVAAFPVSWYMAKKRREQEMATHRGGGNP